MLYAMRGGAIIQAKDRFDLFYQLNRQSLFGNMEDEAAYMKRVSESCQTQDCVRINSSSIEGFMEDLIKEKYIIEIREEDIRPPQNDFHGCS